MFNEVTSLNNIYIFLMEKQDFFLFLFLGIESMGIKNNFWKY